jgi:membrane-associated PAP2 superfamily phosphatase
MKEYFKENARWLVPILLMAAITPFTPYLDVEIERYFYNKGTPPEHFSNSPFLQLIYVYGLVPGQITAILAGIGLLFSYLFPSCKSWRPHALFLVLTLVIGAGLITHVMLKSHWGRPRPRQVIEFGGTQEFRPYYRPNFFDQPEKSKSFVCGHCSLGFYFVTFFLLGRRYRNNKLFYLGIALTGILGAALSYARMAQGGHFLSDVLMSALVMWLTAIVLERLIYED